MTPFEHDRDHHHESPAEDALCAIATDYTRETGHEIAIVARTQPERIFTVFHANVSGLAIMAEDLLAMAAAEDPGDCPTCGNAHARLQRALEALQQGKLQGGSC